MSSLASFFSQLHWLDWAVIAVYFVLLRDYDVNYYLSQRPPEFVQALVLAALLGAGLTALLLRTAAPSPSTFNGSQPHGMIENLA